MAFTFYRFIVGGRGIIPDIFFFRRVFFVKLFVSESEKSRQWLCEDYCFGQFGDFFF